MFASWWRQASSGCDRGADPSGTSAINLAGANQIRGKIAGAECDAAVVQTR
jgi:hypothetical protein